MIVWQDEGVNVRAEGANGRYEVRWPVRAGESGAPDFTTWQEAAEYAECVARAIRIQREVAHATALAEDERRGPKVFDLAISLVNPAGLMWIRTGPDNWAPIWNVFGSGAGESRAELEAREGKLKVRDSIKIRGELA